MNVETDFKTGRIGYLILFVFLSGMIGDILIHTLVKYPRLDGLKYYYKKLEYGSTEKMKLFSSWIISAIFGGLACVVGLLLGELFLYAKESTA